MKVSIKMVNYEPVRVTLEQKLSLRGALVRRDVPIPAAERGRTLQQFVENETRAYVTHVNQLRSARYSQNQGGSNGE